MNSYVGMTMVKKKKQGQDDYFNQQSILLTSPANYQVTATHSGAVTESIGLDALANL